MKTITVSGDKISIFDFHCTVGAAPSAAAGHASFSEDTFLASTRVGVLDCWPRGAFPTSRGRPQWRLGVGATSVRSVSRCGAMSRPLSASGTKENARTSREKSIRSHARCTSFVEQRPLRIESEQKGTRPLKTCTQVSQNRSGKLQLPFGCPDHTVTKSTWLCRSPAGLLADSTGLQEKCTIGDWLTRQADRDRGGEEPTATNNVRVRHPSCL